MSCKDLAIATVTGVCFFVPSIVGINLLIGDSKNPWGIALTSFAGLMVVVAAGALCYRHRQERNNEYKALTDSKLPQSRFAANAGDGSNPTVTVTVAQVSA